jgi:hypothetical protein
MPTPISPLRLAMWSGPRNISTALMRSWGNRPDTVVCDEPLYAHYLRVTGLPHPGRDEVIDSQEGDWRKVAAWLTGPIPDRRPIFYQKHMAHHLLPGIERGWLSRLTHCFLLREPREMLTSLVHFIPEPTLADTGLPQQVELFEWAAERQDRYPPVLDARDVLENPRGMLQALCARLRLPFTEVMLSWPAGPRSTDGVWAKHWYASVEKTTSFEPYLPKPDPVPPKLEKLLEQCEALYERLHPYRLTA